jgi:hypothetical protein
VGPAGLHLPPVLSTLRQFETYLNKKGHPFSEGYGPFESYYINCQIPTLALSRSGSKGIFSALTGTPVLLTINLL